MKITSTVGLSLTEFKLQASAIMLQINNQLAAGYINVQQTLPAYGFGAPDTTNTSGDNIRFYTPLEQVIDLYETDRSKVDHAHSLRYKKPEFFTRAHIHKMNSKISSNSTRT